MPIHYAETVATVEGLACVEDAELLAAWLRSCARPEVDLSQAAHLHTAVVQTLMAFTPVLRAPPPDPWLAALLGRVCGAGR
jgi:hypothetical protein